MRLRAKYLIAGLVALNAALGALVSTARPAEATSLICEAAWCDCLFDDFWGRWYCGAVEYPTEWNCVSDSECQ